MTPSHVPLKVRKGVLARLIVHESVRPVLAEPLDREDHAIIKAAIRTVENRTRTELAAPGNEMTLDEFVVRAVESAALDIENHPRSATRRSLTDAASAMRAAANAISCSTCAKGAPPCRGDRRDDELVHPAGHCLARFRELFEIATEIARAHHAFALGPDALDQWPATSFGTDFVSEGPAHPFASPAQISGRTVVAADALITLTFAADQFQWESYLAAVYVLVHEAFHVMEGAEAGPGREPRDDEDPFVEGWMDWIAFHAFEDVALRRGPAKALRDRLAHAAAQRERAEQLHRARSDDATSSQPLLSLRLRSGVSAAERLYDLCRRLLRDGGAAFEPWRFFLEVSLRINRKGLPLSRHVKLVSRVRRYLPDPGADWRVNDVSEPEAARLRQAIREGNVPETMNWLLA